MKRRQSVLGKGKMNLPHVNGIGTVTIVTHPAGDDVLRLRLVDLNGTQEGLFLEPRWNFWELLGKKATRRMPLWEENKFLEEVAMDVSILLEPLESGRVHARAGEPFALSAEGVSDEEALRRLEKLIADRCARGARIATIHVSVPQSVPLPADELYKTDWVYRELAEAIEENRRAEDATS